MQLTPTRPVPPDWFPPLEGIDLSALASGGGRQGPIVAAAGARVTVVDISEGQLALDRRVAERDALTITTVRCDATDLSAFEDESFGSPAATGSREVHAGGDRHTRAQVVTGAGSDTA